MKPVALLVLVTACGRIGFDPRNDASADARGGFSPPMVVGALSTAGLEDDPTLTADLLEIYFASDRAGGQGMQDIWRAVRNTTAEPWQTPQPVLELNTASNDESPGMTADGLEMFFSSDRGGGSDIYTSTRATRADQWQPPVTVGALSSGAGDFQPQPSVSKLRLLLYRSSGTKDIYEATRAAVGMTWSSANSVSSINSNNGDRSPCLDGSELVIVFSSDRDSPVTDVQDIYIATRPGLGAPFAPAQPLTEINSSFDDDSPWLSPDGQVMFFGSNRSGDIEIYEAHR